MEQKLRVEIFSKFVQISIEKQNEVLPKILKYATKYFQNQYHLSSSILILDDGERFKKDYLINWAYHLAMQEHSMDHNIALDSILEVSYLPIRIKIISLNSLLECVNVSFRMLGSNRAVLILDRPSHIAKRYIGAMLSQIIISSDLTHIYLDSAKNDFWYFLMKIIGNKIIHNVRLEFDYDSFKMNEFGKKSFKSSYLTQGEIKLRNAYLTLGCKNTDSFFEIKSRFFELIKEYHPDKVYGKEEEVVRLYNLKFIEIKEAFDIIKLSFENV